MCDTMVLVDDGRVLFAKNSDRDPNEAQVLDWQPARDHAPGEKVSCTWVTIPQVPHTYAVLLSRPYWMWGAEMGANELGVVIGNEAVFTDQPYAATGLTGMDLLRLALERSTSASEAVTVLTTLLEAHGQGGGCGHEDRDFTYHNSFIVADAVEAYVVETAGSLSEVERVTSGARSISNGLTIEPFATQHRDRLRSRIAACDVRQQRTQSNAAAATGVAGLMKGLRSHTSDSGPRYSLINGAMSAPCMHAGGLVASSQTTASWVSELTADRAAHWATGTAAPCTSIFKPVAVDQPLDLGADPTDVADNSLWWRHERLHRRLLRDPRLLAAVGVERDVLEAKWVEDPPEPSDAFRQADRVEADWLARLGSGLPADRRPVWVRRYWAARDRRAGLWQGVSRAPAQK